MNTSSRFAVLDSEISLNKAHKAKNKVKKEKPKDADYIYPEIKTAKSETQKSSKTLHSKKKVNDLHSMAFGVNKAQGKKNKERSNGNDKENNKKIKSQKVEENHMKSDDTDEYKDANDEWLDRDHKFVENENEKSLQEALTQSRLEFEKIKKKSKKMEEQPDKNQVEEKILKNKKKKKEKTVSLEEFHKPKKIPDSSKQKLPLQESDKTNENHLQKFNEKKFFEEIEDTTKKTIHKERKIEKSNAEAAKFHQEIQLQKLISEIEKRDFEIQALRLEVASVQAELKNVKFRNKKLCEIISASEMRSKGELVVELDKATTNRVEFSEEIVRLTGELEQERTKVSNLTAEIRKLQGKKRTDSCSKPH